MAVITGMSGRILGQTGVSAAFATKPTTDISPATAVRTVYRITDATLRSWDAAVVATVECSTDAGSTWHAAPSNTVQYLGGVVTFAAARAVGELVRVSGNAYPMAAFTFFQSWELNGEVAMLDLTSLGDTAERVLPGLFKGSVKGEGFFIDSYFADKIVGNTTALVILSLDTGAGTYDMSTYLNKLGTKDGKGVITAASREFTVDGSFYFNIP